VWRPAAFVIALCGCGFHVSAGGTDQPSDSAQPIDAAIDAAPDAFVPLPACMTSPQYANGPGGHRYRKAAPTLNYDDAIDACHADGAHLAVINDLGENQYAMTAAAGDTQWIGFDDLTTEGIFRWITGASTYTNWGGSEPNDIGGHEDCAYMTSSGAWNDTDCGDTRGALCECEPGYLAPAAPKACRAMTGANVDVSAGRKYITRTSAATWAAAKADCESIGAYLAVISDLTENDNVDGNFLGDSWIGLSDQATENTFVWVNGSTDAYRQWGNGAPHGNNTGRNCVMVNVDWQDVDCTSTKQYACECDPLPP
jgi:hypothetical protein